VIAVITLPCGFTLLFTLGGVLRIVTIPVIAFPTDTRCTTHLDAFTVLTDTVVVPDGFTFIAPVVTFGSGFGYTRCLWWLLFPAIH